MIDYYDCSKPLPGSDTSNKLINVAGNTMENGRGTCRTRSGSV
jgi:hypothetical protein